MWSDLSVVILAGGKSSRMGTDKAFVRVGGKPIVERIVEQLGGYGAETIVITNKPDDYRYLGLPQFGDVLPDKGALGGLYTAVRSAARPRALVVACDMPFVNLALLDHLVALAPQFDAVVPRLNSPLPWGEGPGVRSEAEPFRAVYSKACLGPMRAALDAGKMRVISFFPDVRVRFVDEPELDRFDPEHLTFFNVNRPEDLERAEELAKENAEQLDAPNASNDERDLLTALDTTAAGHWALVAGQLTCRNCGAVTTLPANQQATVCPFCGSSKVLTQPLTPGLTPPNAIAPFAFDADEAPKRIREWLGGKWFIPDDLIRLGRSHGLRAVYLPFWTFDGHVEVDYQAEYPEESDSFEGLGSRREVVWQWISEYYKHKVDDLLIYAASSVPEAAIKSVMPFDLKALVEYRPEFLADWQAEVHQIALADAAMEARKRMRDDAERGARRQSSIRGRRNFTLSDVRVMEPTYKNALLPVWVAAYTYRGKLYQVLINGQTGKVSGETPIDWVKVAIVAGGVVLFLIFVAVALAFFWK